MRIVTWTIWFLVFLALLGFVAKNVEPVTVRFYFDLALQTKLIIVIFASFAAGALCGVLALLSTFLRQRREINRLNREAERRAEQPQPPAL